MHVSPGFKVVNEYAQVKPGLVAKGVAASPEKEIPVAGPVPVFVTVTGPPLYVLPGE